MRLPLGTDVIDVFPTGKHVVILCRTGVHLATGGRTSQVISSPADRLLRISAWPAADGRVLVLTREKGAEGHYQGGERKGQESDTVCLHAVRPKSGTTEVVKRFWNVADAAVGPAGAYALSHGGGLRRLAGDSFKNFGPTLKWKRIVVVSRKHLWMEGLKGDLALVSARSGAPVRRFEMTAPIEGAFAVDRVADDLVCVLENRAYRVRAETGKVEEIALREE